VGPSISQDTVKKRKNLSLPGIEPGSSSLSLHRLSYPDSSRPEGFKASGDHGTQEIDSFCVALELE
jgi:hypothetical protein